VIGCRCSRNGVKKRSACQTVTFTHVPWRTANNDLPTNPIHLANMYHINYEQSHPTTSIRRRPGINTPVLDPQYTHPIHSPSLYTARKFASPTGHTTSPITLADSQTFYPQIPQLLKPVDLLLKKGDNCQVSSLPSKYPDYPSLLSSRTWSLVSSDIHSSSNLVDTKVASAIFSRKMTHKYPQYVPAAQDGQAHHTEPWTLHKWFLMFSVSTVFVYGLTGLVCALSTWLRGWSFSAIVRPLLASWLTRLYFQHGGDQMSSWLLTRT
jgi:hypothetical protein